MQNALTVEETHRRSRGVSDGSMLGVSTVPPPPSTTTPGCAGPGGSPLACLLPRVLGARSPPPRGIQTAGTLGAAAEARDGRGLATWRRGIRRRGLVPVSPLTLLHSQRAFSRKTNDLNKTTGAGVGGDTNGWGEALAPHTTPRQGCSAPSNAG